MSLRKAITLTFALILCNCAGSTFKGNGTQSKSPPNSTNSVPAGTKLEEFSGAPTEKYKVDIIFLLDSSPSMDTAIKRTNDNLGSLITNYLDKVKNYDYQIFIVGEKVPTVTGEKIEHVKQYVGSHNALNNFIDLASGKIKSEKLKIRPDSVKELVIVSDDESGMKKDEFIKWMDANKSVAAEVHVNGIIYMKYVFGCTGFLGLGFETKVGQTYIDLAKLERTKGLASDMCQNNWAPIFNQLGEQLTKFKTSPKVLVKLQGTPSNPANIGVDLNGKPLTRETEWQYQADQNSVLILTTTTDKDKITVKVW